MKYSDFSIVTGLLFGLILTGCKSLAVSSRQQAENSSSISTPIQTAQIKQIGSTPTIDSQLLVNCQASPAGSSNQFGLRQGMPYREARKLLMQNGWQPHFDGDSPNLSSATVKELFELGYKEIKDCSGTGMGLCRFEFTNATGELLVVSAAIAGSDSRERAVWRWFIEQRTDANQQSSFSIEQIAEGLYVLGGTDQGLEVSAEKYRYYDEMGLKAWKSISSGAYMVIHVIRVARDIA